MMKLKMCTGCGEPTLIKDKQETFYCHKCGKTSKRKKARTIDSGEKEYLLKRRSEIKKNQIEDKESDFSVDYGIGKEDSSDEKAKKVCNKLLDLFEPIEEDELVEKAEQNDVSESKVKEFLKEKEDKGEIYYSKRGIKTI